MSYPCPHCGIDTALAFPGPADEVVIDGKRWRVIPTGFGYDDGSQSCRLVPIEGQVDAAERVQPPPHLTPEEVQEIRDWIATPPTSHVDDLIYRALRELSEIRQYEPPPQDQVDWRVMALRVKHENAGPE